MDTLAKEMGFESEQEFNKLVAEVDLSSPERIKAFRYWQIEDGTKEGLLKLPQKGDTNV